MAVDDYMSTREAAEQWGMTMASVLRLCNLGRVAGAGKVGHAWIIPKDAGRPCDARITTGNGSDITRAIGAIGNIKAATALMAVAA